MSMTTTDELTFPNPGDDNWPDCQDPFCGWYEPTWWPEALAQAALDNADADCSPRPQGLIELFCH